MIQKNRIAAINSHDYLPMMSTVFFFFVIILLLLFTFALNFVIIFNCRLYYTIFVDDIDKFNWKILIVHHTPIQRIIPTKWNEMKCDLKQRRRRQPLQHIHKVTRNVCQRSKLHRFFHWKNKNFRATLLAFAPKCMCVYVWFCFSKFKVLFSVFVKECSLVVFVFLFRFAAFLRCCYLQMQRNAHTHTDRQYYGCDSDTPRKHSRNFCNKF